jgi:hypothetical protein
LTKPDSSEIDEHLWPRDEMADMPRLERGARKGMGVQVPPRLQLLGIKNMENSHGSRTW